MTFTAIRLFDGLPNARGVAVQSVPGFSVDFGLERGAQGFVRVGDAEEVGVAEEERFAVIVGVDEPAGVTFGRRTDCVDVGTAFFRARTVHRL